MVQIARLRWYLGTPPGTVHAALLALVLVLLLWPRPCCADGTPDLAGQWTVYATWNTAWLHYVYDDCYGIDEGTDYYPPLPGDPPFAVFDTPLLWWIANVTQAGNSLHASAPLPPYGDIVFNGTVTSTFFSGTVTYPTFTYTSGDVTYAEMVSYDLTGAVTDEQASGAVIMNYWSRYDFADPDCPGSVTMDGQAFGTFVAFRQDRVFSLEALDDLAILGEDDVIWDAMTRRADPVADTLASTGFTLRASISAPGAKPSATYSWAVEGTDRLGSGALTLAQDPSSQLWIGSFPVGLPSEIGKYTLDLHVSVTSRSGTSTTDSAHTLYVTYDEPVCATGSDPDAYQLLLNSDLPLKKDWLDAATSWAQGTGTAAGAASHLVDGIYQSGRWTYRDGATDWRSLLGDASSSGNCVSFANLWGTLGRILGFPEFHCLPITLPYTFGFATVSGDAVRSLDGQTGNAYQPAAAGADRWVFGMHRIGQLGTTTCYDPTFGQVYAVSHQFIDWPLACGVSPSPEYDGAPRSTRLTGLPSDQAFHDLAGITADYPWGKLVYRPNPGYACAVYPSSLPLVWSTYLAPITFQRVDANSDGTYDSLEAHTTVTLPDANVYTLTGLLLANGTPVTARAGHGSALQTSATVGGGPGAVSASLRFSGMDIRDSGLDGPYTAVLSLRGPDGGVEDEITGSSPTYSYLSFGEADRAPGISALADVTLPELWPIVIIAEASDPDGDIVELSAAPLPDGASFDPYSGTFEWTPRLDQAGVYRIVFSASDGLDGTPELVTITVLERPRFRDVPSTYWAFAQIEACAAAGIVSGYWDGYHPEESVTRSQMAVYISRALAGGDGGVPPGPASATFPDVPTSHWAYRYVEYCQDQGIVGGYWDGTYHPDEDVNRAQMAVYVARAMAGGDGNVPTGPATAFFPDVSDTHWAYKYVEYCHDHGVVGGYWDGTYRPDEAVNRGAMAVYVQRAFALPI